MEPGTSSIAAERKRLGLSQRELANYLGVDPMTVSRWERGRSRPRGRTAEQVRTLFARGTTRTAKVQISDESETSRLAELIRIVGPAEAIRLLRRKVLQQTAPRPARFPVDPRTRLRELGEILEQQSNFIDRARIG